MIHEDEDEVEPVNFSWIYFIGSAKLNLRLKEIGRLTWRQFLGLYKAYKNTFDLELYLKLARKTYDKLSSETEESEEWL